MADVQYDMNARFTGIQLINRFRGNAHWAVFVPVDGNPIAFGGDPRRAAKAQADIIETFPTSGDMITALYDKIADGYVVMFEPLTFEAPADATPTVLLTSYLAAGPITSNSTRRLIDTFSHCVDAMIKGAATTEPEVWAVFVSDGDSGRSWELNSLHSTEVGANKRMAERQAEPMTKFCGYEFRVEAFDVED